MEVVVDKLFGVDRQVPINLDDAAKLLNVVRVSPMDMPFSGELRRARDGLEVLYSIHLSPERQRFTVAHELGHAILNLSGTGAPTHGSELERVCDKLAAEILMPRKHFRRSCDRNSSLGRISKLATVYRTSLTATAIRYAELFGGSVFEVNEASISWGYGVIKKGPLVAKDPSIQFSIDKIMTNGGSLELIPYTTKEWAGRWKLEAQHLGPKRALFLFRPYHSARAGDV